MASSSQGAWFYQRDVGNGVNQTYITSSHATTPGMPFRKRSERVDWKRIASVDIDGIARNMDYNALQNNLANVTYCNIELETDTRTIDPNFVKLFKLSQLSIEYLLHSQDYLSTMLSTSEEATKKAQQEHSNIQKQLTHLQDELATVKKESHKRKKMIITLQQMLQTGGAGSYHRCPYCTKAFVTSQFLQSHIGRRHNDRLAPPPQQAPTPAPLPPPPPQATVSPDAVSALEKELRRIQERLANTEEQLNEERNARNSLMQKVKSDQAKHELMKDKEMDKWKDEQLKQHEQEINNLRELFGGQLAELENKYKSERAALAELQKKFSQKQSFLGELQDEDTAERKMLKQEIETLQSRLSQQEEMQEQNAMLERRLQELERKQKIMRDDEKRRREEAQMKRDTDEMRRETEELKRKLYEQDKIHWTNQQSSRFSNVQLINDESLLQALMVSSEFYREERQRTPDDTLLKAEELQAVGSVMNRPLSREELTSSYRSSGQVSDDDELDGTSSMRNTAFSGTLSLGNDRSEELKRLLDNDPNVLKQLKIEINGLLAVELEKRGIARDAKGIDSDTLREKMKILQTERQQDAKTKKNLNDIRQQYITTVDTKARSSTDSRLSAGYDQRNSLKRSATTTPVQERRQPASSLTPQNQRSSARLSSESRPPSQISPKQQQHVQFQAQSKPRPSGGSYYPPPDHANNNNGSMSPGMVVNDKVGSNKKTSAVRNSWSDDDDSDDMDEVDGKRTSGNKSPGQFTPASPLKPTGQPADNIFITKPASPQTIQAKPLVSNVPPQSAVKKPVSGTSQGQGPPPIGKGKTKSGAAEEESDIFTVSSDTDEEATKQPIMRKQATQGSSHGGSTQGASTDASTVGTSVWGSVNSSGISSVPKTNSSAVGIVKKPPIIDNDFDDDSDEISDM